MLDKNQLRRSLLNIRQQIDITEWQQKNQQICNYLKHTAIFSKSKTVLAYFSIKNEPDISILFTSNYHLWGFPRCVGQQMIWHQWQLGETLQIGTYGISEPNADATKILPSQVDLILLPCVACDRRGYRLGYGGGYYDRMLSSPEWKGIPTMGIVFASALVPELPIEAWDCQLDYVCTEMGII